MGDIKENNRDLLENLFIESNIDGISDVDDTLQTPVLVIDIDNVDNKTKERAKVITEKLAEYYFDPKYVAQHPYISNKISQEIDNIRRLLKMLSVNERAQDTLIMSITSNSGKGALYSSLTSLQNSMLSMQSQLNQLTANLENIFKEMQENCEETFEQKDKEESTDGTYVVRGSRDFIKEMNKRIYGETNEQTENLNENIS